MGIMLLERLYFPLLVPPRILEDIPLVVVVVDAKVLVGSVGVASVGPLRGRETSKAQRSGCNKFSYVCFFKAGLQYCLLQTLLHANQLFGWDLNLVTNWFVRRIWPIRSACVPSQ